MKLGRNELLHRMSGIRLLTLDVDGVLTDGGLYYADDGSELRGKCVHLEGEREQIHAGMAENASSGLSMISPHMVIGS